MVRIFKCLIDDASWIVHPCGQVVIFYGNDTEGFPVNRTKLDNLEREIWHGTVEEITPLEFINLH